MVNAGRDITANLILDATEFQSELTKTSTAVAKFKESMMDLGKDSANVKSGIDLTSRAIKDLLVQMDKFSGLEKQINNFKQFSLALEHLALAAQRLAIDTREGGLGIQTLTSVMDVWRAGVESAEIKVTGLATALKNMRAGTTSASESTSSMTTTFKSAVTDLNNLTRSFYTYGEGVHTMTQSEANARAITQLLRKELGLTGEELVKVRERLIENGSSVAQYKAQIERMRAEFEKAKADLLAFANGGVEAFNKILTKVTQVNTTLNSGVSGINTYRNALYGLSSTATTFGSTMNGVNTTLVNGTQRQINMGQALVNTTTNMNTQNSSASTLTTSISNLNAQNTTLGMKEKEVANATNQETSSLQRQQGALSQSTAKTNQLTSATNKLKSALSSLRMVGTLVGSMLAYNFAHKLLVATGETIHAKSEMEGYFKMLNFGQSDIDHFNQALDRTVSQFQRVNKYSLGETISSIGVEFNLTTQEMEKAMKVTSMITSEYLRAGRNANEASLAVKDVLQGQFQRLSRETGVKGEQLKEAGWSGDTTDVLGLMKALEKVAESRNWDVFAEKANSLNDILTISQNRFGEWSADLVNVVQPAIVNFFNSFMSFSQGVAEGLTAFWQWLNTDGWGQTAVKIGLVGTALLTTSQMLLMYRTEMGLVELSQLGLKNSIASLVLGLKGQELAEVGVRNAILSKILGVEAESLAEKGVTGAIQSRLVALRTESVQNQIASTQEKLKTLATEENTVAEELNTLQQDLNTASTQKLITAKEEETIQEEINTAQKELNSIASLEQTEANSGLIASLYLLGTGEAIVTGETSALTIAWGVLNGVFALSPIGWLTTAILGLAGAIYVLTGGLDEGWSKMKTFHETVNQGLESLKPYQDRVNSLGEQLDEAKAKYGENSDQVKNLQEKYDNAKDSLDKFNESLQYGTKITQELNDEQSQLTANLDAITRKNYGSFGHSTEETDAVIKQMNDMGYGYDQSYIALQKLVRMQENFERDQKRVVPLLTDHGRGLLENAENMGKWNKAYQEYIEHSTKANIAEDWWTWAWESFYAGQAKNKADAFAGLESMESTLRDKWNNIWTEITSPDGVQFFKGNIDEQISNFVNSIGDSWNSFWDGLDLAGSINNWWQGVSDAIQNFDFVGFFTNIDLFGKIWEAISSSFNNGDGATGEKTFNFAEMIKGLLDFANIDLSWIPSSVETYIVAPFRNWLVNGIMNIPILGSVLSLLGTLLGANGDAHDKGSQIAKSFQNALENIIASIPILSDILRILGIIPQANPTASSNGQGVGNAIKDGLRNGISGLASIVSTEIQNVINVVKNAVGQAYQSACDVGNAIVNGVKSAMNINSPGILSTEIVWREFAEHIPDAISDSAENAYNTAVNYGQRIVDGVSSVNFNSFDTMATDYQTDAQDISATTQMLGMDTTTAFNDMALAVNTVTGTMGTNVASTYTSMQTKQMSSLDTMKQKNTTAFNDMYTKSNQSLVQMRDSTSNITTQMTHAWSHMKDQIVATANQLKTESTNHFNQLSNTIGSFYRKIQNPSNWGAGSKTPSNVSARTSRNPSVGRSFARGISTRTNVHGAGGGSYTGSSTMSIAQLKKMLCPNGDCGNLFDGYSITDRVNVEDFLASITGEHGVGWTGWNSTHYNYIKDVSDKWDTGSPVINLVGGIPTSAKFKVGDFESGTPKISFSEFQSMAEAIFSRIPYKLYYDSSWKGSWLGALQAGACNCSDGADALIAFAQTCGFDGYKQHGYWGSTGHFWAVINGKVMDTTAWQDGYGWTSPKVHGYGSPDVRRAVHNPSMQTTENGITINIDMSDSTFYGENDLESRIEESIDRGLEKHFNKSYAVGI